MKVALVHDYLGEFGGAERVLLALSEIWPEAPIYTAFYKKGPAWERLKNRDIRVSWAHYIPGFSTFLYSPLRFLAPFIWNSFDFSQYDLIITSASWYVTKGVVKRTKDKGQRTIEICYCHTPPRYLYGYPTSVEWAKYWPVRVYAGIVNHFMRMYDWNSAQKVDYFIANSENVRRRIEKFYRREAEVIYPPVELPKIKNQKLNIKNTNQNLKSYYLIVSRVVGGKGLELAVEAANKMGFPLKVVGAPAGYSTLYKGLQKKAKKNVEFLGFVSDEKLVKLYAGAKAFLALARDEDFGITPVEAMLSGTPVIAYKGGGYMETVIDGKTGIFFDDYSVQGLAGAIKKFQATSFNPVTIKKHTEKFSKERFKKQIKEFINSKIKN